MRQRSGPGISSDIARSFAATDEVERIVNDPKKLFISGIAFALTALPAFGVEGALGRTLPGIWIQPQGAVVGPKPGFSFTTLPIGYMGRIGGARQVPIGGVIFANVQANVNSNYLVPQYVYKTEGTKISLSS